MCLYVFVSLYVCCMRACIHPHTHLLTFTHTFIRIIHRYYLTGPKAGTWDTFASNLPGLPDNLSHSKRGTIWVPFASTRKHPLVDVMFKHTWIRKLVCKVSVHSVCVRSSFVLSNTIKGFRYIAPCTDHKVRKQLSMSVRLCALCHPPNTP